MGRGLVPRECRAEVGTIWQRGWAAVNYSCRKGDMEGLWSRVGDPGGP